MAEEFDNFKKSIKTVEVTINDEKVKIPISYNLKAHEEYKKKFKESHEYKESFFTMLFDMIKSDWEFINEKQPMNIKKEDLQGLSQENICEIVDIILKESGYFNQLKEVFLNEEKSCFEKFHVLHQKETEECRKQIEKITKVTSKVNKKFSNIYSPIMPQLDRIMQIQNSLAWINEHHENIIRMNEVFNNNIASTIEATKIHHINFDYDHSALIAASQSISPSVQRMLGNIDKLNKMLNPPVLESLRNSMIHTPAIVKVIEQQQNTFNHSVMQFERIFKHQDKLIEFTKLTEELSRRIRPFLIDISTINIGRYHVKEHLKKKIKKLYDSGWCVGNSILEELIEEIYDEQDVLKDEEIDKIIVDFFDKNNYEALDNICLNWSDFPYLDPFKKQCNDAINHYKMGTYWTGVDAFTAIMEGMIRNFARERYNIFERSIWQYVKPLKRETKQLEDFVSKYFFQQFNTFYDSFKPEEEGVTSDFNRNKIKHGIAFDYDKKEYALKLILMMNDIIAIISSISELEVA